MMVGLPSRFDSGQGQWQRSRERKYNEASRETLPKATHGSPDHPLRIGDIEIPCYVLENGVRVIVQSGLQRDLGMAETGGMKRLATLVERYEAKGIDCKDLAERIVGPVRFTPPNGGIAYGYEATVLADICDAILAARKAGLLLKQQSHIAGTVLIWVEIDIVLQ